MLSRHTKRAILGFLFVGVLIILTAAATKHYFAAQALEIRLAEERAELVVQEPMLFTVKRDDRSRERAFAVRLEPDRRTEVAAEVSGQVEEMRVEVGDFVEKDEVIVRLDATLAQLNLAASQAALEAGEAQLRELRRKEAEAERLVGAQTIPETQWEAARSQAEVQAREVERLRAEVRRQEELVSRYEVRAPFAGHINRRFVETGDSVNVNQALVSLVTLDPLRARFYVSDLEVGSFQPGQELRLTVSARPGEAFSAPVHSVARSAHPLTGLYLVEARVSNEDGSLRGGLQGRIHAKIARYEDMIFVPATAVRYEGNRTVVEVWTDGESELREIRIGPETDGFYPVLEGLEAGDVLVVH